MADRSDPGNAAEGTITHAREPALRRWTVQVVLGLLVLAAGVLLLIEVVLHAPVPGALWAGLLAAGSAAFWYACFAQPPTWWAAIPAGALLGAAIASLMALDPGGAGRWTGVPFLAALSAGFWTVYLRSHRRWWALLPGGALLTLAVVTGVTEAVGGQMAGVILLLGLAVSFMLVAVLPTGQSRHRWAWIVAAALAAVALVVLLQTAEVLVVLEYAWPLAVVGAGAYLLWTAWRRRRTLRAQHSDDGRPAERLPRP